MSEVPENQREVSNIQDMEILLELGPLFTVSELARPSLGVCRPIRAHAGAFKGQLDNRLFAA